MSFARFKTLITQHKKTTLIIALLLVIITGYALYKKWHGAPTPPEDIKVVEIEKVKLKDIQETTAFIGTIKSEQSTMLIAKSRGILDGLISSGRRVKKGELIAKIDNKDVERNYKLSQEVEKIAKLQYDRLNQLYKKGAMTKNAVEQKESEWMEQQKKMSDAKIALDQINIQAPFDGIVGVFKVREGSQVQEGDPIVNFYDPSSTIVEFDVPVSIVGLIQDGNPVFINKKRYALTHIQKMLDEETHMSPAYVKIQCDNCIIGTTVNVDLVVKEKKSVIVIPHESVFLREGKTFVYVMKNNQAALVPVELGIREKESVEIISGLNEGDAVIIRGQARLYPGVAVKLSSTEKVQDKK